MIEIITWNVQAGLGVDGEQSLERIAEVVSRMGDPDVICFQEVCQYMPYLDGGHGADQIAELQMLFGAHEPVFGPSVDRIGHEQGCRQRFGNLILSKLPVLQAFCHSLPQPADPDVKHIPRQATEVVVDTKRGPLRIVTTHLEFHSDVQRRAQVTHLRSMHQETWENLLRPAQDPGDGLYAAAPRPLSAIYCGDFNFPPDDHVYAQMLKPFAEGAGLLVDAWTACYGSQAHAPTCGIFDQQQWPEGPHCRDYFFITDDLASRAQSVTVDLETSASDHQPVRLLLDV